MNNKGVSAVIGVILMVALTVAISATVFVYISGGLYQTTDNENISGIIVDKFIVGYNIPHYYFILDYVIECQVNLTIYYEYNIGDFYESSQNNL